MSEAITETTENNALSLLPEKFRDLQTGEVRLEALVNSYLELERRLSAAPDSDEGRTRLLRQLGVPETSDGYDIDVAHGLFTVDPEVNDRLHKMGCTCEQAQEIYNLAAEKLVPVIREIVQDYQADREVEKLVSAFGGPDKWREISRQLLAFGSRNLPKDVFENLSSSYDGIMALYRMMKGQEPGIGAVTDEAVAPAPGETDLRSLMRDPRYWRKKDPAFVARVTEGFKTLYKE